jgi:hypothetical protein
MTQLIIVGAGIAGLLAANMLKHHNPVVIEAQPALPNNHSAVLRFRSAIVGETLGIPFRRVSVLKAAVPHLNPVADALAYSLKTTGIMRSDRSITTSGFETVERFIAPSDLIARMAKGIEIKFNFSYNPPLADPRLIVVSTIPMPTLIKLLDYQPERREGFYFSNGLNVAARIRQCSAYASLYVPEPYYPFSRVSLTEDEMIAEISRAEDGQAPPETARWIAVEAANLLGVEGHLDMDSIVAKPQKYSKILPLAENARRSFIHWATINHNVFSLGRFATWRPGLLTDDLVKDIRLIDSWISSGNNYDVARKR